VQSLDRCRFFKLSKKVFDLEDIVGGFTPKPELAAFLAGGTTGSKSQVTQRVTVKAFDESADGSGNDENDGDDDDDYDEEDAAPSEEEVDLDEGAHERRRLIFDRLRHTKRVLFEVFNCLCARMNALFVFLGHRPEHGRHPSGVRRRAAGKSLRNRLMRARTPSVNNIERILIISV